MTKALEGIRVIDLGRYIAAPYGAMMMADMGADVIRIDKPGGEPDRRLRPFVEGTSIYAQTFNRNKRCITLNLRTEEGKQYLIEMIKKADVLINNFRPGIMDSMGLSFEKIQELNPRMIVASISGFGQKGPLKDRAAFDGIPTAMAGVMYENFSYGKGPKPFGTPVADVTTAYINLIAILMALLQREKTGKGQYIDTAMTDCMVPYLESMIPTYFVNGPTPNFGKRNGGDPTSAPANVFKASDGYVYIHAGISAHYILLADMIGDERLNRPEYRDQNYRRDHFEEVEAVVGEWVAKHTAKEVEDAVSALGIPTSKLNTIGDLLESDYVKSRNQIIWMEVPGIEGKYPFPGSPLKLSDCMVDTYKSCGVAGCDNDEVFKDIFGLDEAKIAELREKGII
ncbi:CaiB/BaiF CoA-transferase family protein [uncultured Dysosmobacter sp.]|uniref:CaiB/BaiF CoA transferase family protein n=1 Tax=uncultured Dysosmobacter sp. TaxID=2591384 RepID=UPI00260E583C|nr:CaiB/BaiF CoA-transferase family protein [uncultured Dysosmobacter sp.]